MGIIYLLLNHSVVFALDGSKPTRIDEVDAVDLPGVLLKTISVRLDSVNLKTALDTIAQLGDFRLNYNSTHLPMDKQITVHMSNVWTLDVLLSVLRGTGLELLMTTGKQLIIVQKKSQKVKTSGGIVGKVMSDMQPFPNAIIRLVKTLRGAVTDSVGAFYINNVPEREYTVEVSHLGYEKQRVEKVQVHSDSTISLTFHLVPKVYSLDELVVMPGRFSIMQKDPVVQQSLSKEDIRSVPQFGEDIYRAVSRLPGVAANDWSAQFTVRGGEHDEVLVLLDGLELYEPFHFKDFGGIFSIVDVMAIDGIDLMTGAFPAMYGNHMSGVFNISSRSAPEETHTSVGISLMNARVISEGVFGQGRGHWLISFRPGYLDLLVRMTGGANDNEEFSVRYYDALAKAQYQLNDRHTLSAHFLGARDKFFIAETSWDTENEISRLKSEYGNVFTWLRLQSLLRTNLWAETVLSIGKVSRQRNAHDTNPFGRVNWTVEDKRDFVVWGAKQNWNWDASKRLIVYGGFDLKRLSAQYDYLNRLYRFTRASDGQFGGVYDTTQVAPQRRGSELGIHLGARLRIVEPLAVEVGGRYDRVSYTRDRDYSPRINALLNLGQQTSLRAGWGRFYQHQSIQDLDIAYGDQIFYPSQMKEHHVISLEHRFALDTNVRVEGYWNNRLKNRPRYTTPEQFQFVFPEVESKTTLIDPEKGESKGVEVYFKGQAGPQVSWWMSYGLAWAEERVGERTIPWDWDQRHTVYLDFTYHLSSIWRINFAWQYRSGWPYSQKLFVKRDAPEDELPYEEDYGLRNAERFPSYHRLDMRMNWYWPLKEGRVSVSLELLNVYDRKNVLEYNNTPYVPYAFDSDGLLQTGRTSEGYWISLMPSFGVSWEF